MRYQTGDVTPVSTKPASKKRILLVDDDRAFLDMLGELMHTQQPDAWDVHLAASTAQALSMLREHSIDLVVLDIQMPVVDGIQFLRLLERKYPDLRKAVLTGHGDAARRAECTELGAELFLDKPQTAEGYEIVLAALQELAAVDDVSGFRGTLRKAGIVDLLQTECAGRHTSILAITSPQLRGRIHVLDGDIIHAEAGKFSGVEALNRLLALAGGDFKLEAFAPPAKRTIEGPWQSLLANTPMPCDAAAEFVSIEDAPTPEPALQPIADNVATQGQPAAGPSAAAPGADVVIEEIVLCAGAEGAVLHEWQCRNVKARMKLFEQVAAAAARISKIGGFGKFLRCEALAPPERLVVQFKSDRQLLVRTRRGASAPAKSR